LTPKLSAIGVTRLANITGLDYIGLPVVMSVRPIAKSLSVQQGKGLTLEAAKVSAIMESVESFSSQRRILEIVWRRFSLCTDSTYIYPHHFYRRKGLANALIPWVWGRDLFTSRPILVPQELVTTDSSFYRPKGYGWFGASSNGLGAGNNIAEAQLHGICEVIERDAYALWRHSPRVVRAAKRIDITTVHDATVNRAVQLLNAANIDLNVWDITSDVRVPCFFCAIDDSHARSPGLGRFGGMGCHPSAGIAVGRAILEAVQSRLTFIAGSREDLRPQSYRLIGATHNIGSLLFRDNDINPDAKYWPPSASIDQPSIEQDLSQILEYLLRVGIETVAVVDLTDDDLQIPCVRVIIPDLEGTIDSHLYSPGDRARRVKDKCIA
jgi:ribosomal protein S12 methylthiotransferase accessory factor